MSYDNLLLFLQKHKTLYILIILWEKKYLNDVNGHINTYIFKKNKKKKCIFE